MVSNNFEIRNEPHEPPKNGLLHSLIGYNGSLMSMMRQQVQTGEQFGYLAAKRG